MVSRARVLIVGMGGLGCPASLALARGGVRRLTLADPDVVELSNLHRQLWHTEADLGRPKVRSAQDKLSARSPGMEVTALQTRVDARTADALFAEHELVIDAVDGGETKFILSDAAVRTGTPLVHAGVLRMEGQVLHVGPGGPCLRCVFEEPAALGPSASCAQAGVLGTVAGVIGGLQGELGLEVLRGRPADGELRRFDGRTLRWHTLRARRAADCAGCGDRAGERARA